VNKAEALSIFATAFVRELLRDDEPPPAHTNGYAAPTPDDDPNPQPRFDFDESNDYCEHSGYYIPKIICPEHGPQATEDPAPTAEELDGIAGEDPPPNIIARAERARARREKQAANERLFPEDIEMRGMAPPPPE
jgi:hypothetical protein